MLFGGTSVMSVGERHSRMRDLMREIERARRADQRAEAAEEARERDELFERRRSKKMERKRPQLEQQAARRDQKKAERKREDRLVRYGISAAEFCERMDRQNHACAICGTCLTERQAFVDHCHATGIVRDLLCTLCNSGLGFARDSPEVLRAMADYVERHASREHPAFVPDPETRPSRRGLLRKMGGG